ncbi:MAG: AMP-binding protein [Lautropia sp.]|nr:AMP-binding protein [Lautropia sp.]
METRENRFWLKHYPEGVPADVDPDAYRSLAHLLEASMAAYAEREALVCLGRSVRYGELAALSRDMAAWLQSLGLREGCRVALMMPNCLPYVVSLFGVLRAGLVAVNVNPLYTPRELTVQLKDSGAEAIVVLENFGATLAKVIDNTAVKHVVLVSMGDLQGWLKGRLINAVLRHVKKMVPPFDIPGAQRFASIMARGKRMRFQAPVLSGDQLAFLQYTGGTTGVPKGAMLTHRNMVANVLQDEAWFYPAMRQSGKAAPSGPLVFAGLLPLYHVYALMVCLLVSMRVGGLLVLLPNPRDVKAVVKALKPHKVVVFPGISTLYDLLLGDASFRALDFSDLRITVGGGMAVPSSVAAHWQEVTGCPVCEGYGMSEASPTVSCSPTDTKRHDGTVGLPLPSTEIRVVDEAMQPLPPGEVGEVLVRGPQVMAGYWQRPNETAEFMTPDGFFRTGDIGVLDQRGFLRLVDRKKDVILVSGFNVYSNEIEEVVMSHTEVKACAAIGVPDARSGQSVKIYVVRTSSSLTEQALIEYCATRLTGYKRPREVAFVKSLPKSDIGKVLRRQLRDGSVVPERDEGR